MLLFVEAKSGILGIAIIWVIENPGTVDVFTITHTIVPKSKILFDLEVDL